LERIWREVAVAYFEVLSQHSSERAEENHGRPLSGYPVSMIVFSIVIPRGLHADTNVSGLKIEAIYSTETFI
jgi:hypothetical protein